MPSVPVPILDISWYRIKVASPWWHPHPVWLTLIACLEPDAARRTPPSVVVFLITWKWRMAHANNLKLLEFHVLRMRNVTLWPHSSVRTPSVSVRIQWRVLTQKPGFVVDYTGIVDVLGTKPAPNLPIVFNTMKNCLQNVLVAAPSTNLVEIEHVYRPN